MDVIHTLIDMVYTMLLFCMQFCMKITLQTNVHPNLFYFHELTWSTMSQVPLLVDSTCPFP
jgi:uncharacterized membrane protein